MTNSQLYLVTQRLCTMIVGLVAPDFPNRIVGKAPIPPVAGIAWWETSMLEIDVGVESRIMEAARLLANAITNTVKDRHSLITFECTVFPFDPACYAIVDGVALRGSRRQTRNGLVVSFDVMYMATPLQPKQSSRMAAA